MTGYEKKFYEKDVPEAVKALKEIAVQLNALRDIIISDPGDEVEPITTQKKHNIPEDYRMD